MVNLVVEILVYNENFQAGLYITFEFLINNAGNVDKFYNAKPFFNSRYDQNFHRVSKTTKNFLIFLDVIYWIGLIWLAYQTIKRIIMIILIKIRFKILKIYTSDIVDTLVFILSLISVVYRFIICKYLLFNYK